MMIKTQDGERNVASKGLGGAALGLAIPGTVALVNQLAGGAWNIGRSSTGCYNSCDNGCHNHVTHDTRVIGALESELARVNSERYADMIGINTFKEAKTMVEKSDATTQANFKELLYYLTGLDKQVAVDRTQTECNFKFLDSKIDNNQKEMFEYVNGRFVPGKLIMPKSSICPEPLSACTPVVVNPQVIATTAATTEGEVSLNSVSVKKG